MASSILIITDFSAASTHSLNYTCFLSNGKDVQLTLVHVYSVPVNYTADGIALVSVGEAINHASDQLEDELERIRAEYPEIKINGKVLTGTLKEVLVEEIATTSPFFIVMSTSGYENLFPGDTDPLDILHSLSAPVLFIPINAPMIPIREVVYACNYAYVSAGTPTREIIDWIHFMGARLLVVHADTEPEGSSEVQKRGESLLKEELAPLQPEFHWLQDDNILRAVGDFTQSGKAECIIVVPRRFGIWENLFQHSQTKALARLNKIPVLAFHNRIR